MARKKRKRAPKVPPTPSVQAAQRRKKAPKVPPPAPNPVEALKTPPEPVQVPPGGQIVVGGGPPPPTGGHTPVPVVLEAPPPEDDDTPSLQYLRFSAGLAYTTDVNGVTIAELAKRPPFVGVVSAVALQKWSEKDQWVARREALMLDWRRQIEAKMGQRVVQNAVNDLEWADQMFNQALNKVLGGVGAVNSYEGLINATVRLMEFRSGLRDKVLSAVAPTPGQVNPGSMGSMPKPKLSVEDARAAASAIIHRRREQIRAEQARREAEAEAKKGEEPKPPELRLLPGAKGT